MTDADVVAHVYLRVCRRAIHDALNAGDSGAASRAMLDLNDFLNAHPQYDDGTYRAVS